MAERALAIEAYRWRLTTTCWAQQMHWPAPYSERWAKKPWPRNCWYLESIQTRIIQTGNDKWKDRIDTVSFLKILNNEHTIFPMWQTYFPTKLNQVSFSLLFGINIPFLIPFSFISSLFDLLLGFFQSFLHTLSAPTSILSETLSVPCQQTPLHSQSDC